MARAVPAIRSLQTPLSSPKGLLFFFITQAIRGHA
uniref:Uncharacterized protein n=1 Tax=Anguilla anguilla TaxID=7936 RepID=A0A0E9SQ51_ANGAN